MKYCLFSDINGKVTKPLYFDTFEHAKVEFEALIEEYKTKYRTIYTSPYLSTYTMGDKEGPRTHLAGVADIDFLITIKLIPNDE